MFSSASLVFLCIGFLSFLLRIDCSYPRPLWVIPGASLRYPRPLWVIFPGALLRASCCPLLCFPLVCVFWVCFLLALLDLFLLIPTHKYPDLSLFFVSNLSLLASGLYPLPSAKACTYALSAAPWSSNQNGVCPLVMHQVMQQESEHPLGACLLDLFVDLTYLPSAEDDLFFGDGLSHVFLESSSGYLCFGFYLFGIVIGVSTAQWIGLSRVVSWCFLLLVCALLSPGCCSILRSSLADQESGLAWFKFTESSCFLCCICFPWKTRLGSSPCNVFPLS